MNAIDVNGRIARKAAQFDAQPFVDLYENHVAGQAGDSQIRRQAAAILRQGGFPTRQTEAWKYTDLRALSTLSPAPGHPPVAAGRVAALLDRLDLGDAALQSGELAEAPRLVFVNGRFDAAFSRTPSGVTVEPGASFGSRAHPERDALVALNTMLADDGARIHVPAGLDAGRLLLVMLNVGADAGGAAPVAQPRLSVVLDAASRLSLLEIVHGEGVYVNNPVLDIELREHSHLTHVLLQDEGAEALHFSTVYSAVAAGASYDSFSLALGARLARHEVHADLLGRGGEVQVNGAQLLSGSQHADLTSVIAHEAPACSSRQTVKNVLAGKSHGVFQGKIVVARIAQKTDGFQMNQALLLSDSAEIDSKPELEIYADDVKCSHGATAGALDEDQLFYLRSRGVPAHEARSMLVRAFVADALGLIDDPVVRGLLERAADRSWNRRQA